MSRSQLAKIRSDKVGEIDDDDEEEATPLQVLINGIEKVMKIKRWQRKKKFVFADMVKYLLAMQNEDTEGKTQLANELLLMIRPKLTDKIQKIMGDKINKLATMVNRSSTSISQISYILEKLKD